MDLILLGDSTIRRFFAMMLFLLVKWVKGISGCLDGHILYMERQPENGFCVFRLPIAGSLNVLFLLFLKCVCFGKGLAKIVFQAAYGAG